MSDPAPPIILRYDQRTIAIDGARALIGLAATLGPIVYLEPLTWLVWVLGIAAVLFALFAIKTIDRAITRIELSGSMISRRGFLSRKVDIASLDHAKLSYFGRRNASGKGWMTLTLGEKGRRISVDSTLDRFDDLAHSAAQAIRKNALHVDPTTVHNFSMLGHPLQDE